MCIAAKAVYLKDESLCDEMDEGEQFCYQALALHDNSFTVDDCLKQEDFRHFCIVNVAARTNDPSLCQVAYDISAEKPGEGLQKPFCEDKVRSYTEWKENLSNPFFEFN